MVAMEKSVIITLMLLPFVVSCQVDVPEGGTPAPESVFASVESLDATKTELGPEGRILWMAGDQIDLWSHTTSSAKYQVDGNSVGQADGRFYKLSSASSSGSSIGATVAFYPYASSLSCAASGDGFVVGGVTLPETQTYAEDSFGNGALPMVSVSSGDDLAFKLVCGVLKLQFTGSETITSIVVRGNGDEILCGGATVTAASGADPAITMTGAGKTVTLDCGSGVRLSGSEATAFDIVLPPVTMSRGFSVTVNSSDGKSMSVTSDKVQTIKRARILRMPTLAFEASGPDVTDLSASGTANCYIVPAAGTYKFRADVKGNTTEAVTYVAEAEVLWESFGTASAPTAGAIIQSASFADGYISFTATGVEGNAVIAAKTSGGVVRWSWHIWCTDRPADQVYGNGAGTMMDRNLGATSATPGEVGTLGLMYQWGRKDPFLGASGTARLTTAKAASTLSWPSSVEVEDVIGSKSNLSTYSLQHPTTFITNGNYSILFFTNSIFLQCADDSCPKYLFSSVCF